MGAVERVLLLPLLTKTFPNIRFCLWVEVELSGSVLCPQNSLNKILLVVDDSDISRKAAVFAANLARDFAVEVNVLAVIPDIVSMLKEYGRIAEVHHINNNRGKIEEALFIDQANRAVATAMACLGKVGGGGCPVVKKGVPSHEIIAAAKNHDLLIIGNPGKPAPQGQGSILDALLASPQISTIFVQ